MSGSQRFYIAPALECGEKPDMARCAGGFHVESDCREFFAMLRYGEQPAHRIWHMFSGPTVRPQGRVYVPLEIAQPDANPVKDHPGQLRLALQGE